MGHNRAKLAGEAVTLVVQEAEFYGADSGPQDHAAWRHNDPLLLPVLLEYLERRSACLFTDVLNRLDDIRQVWGDRRRWHQNTRRAVASMRGRRTLWILSRVMTSAARPRTRDV